MAKVKKFIFNGVDVESEVVTKANNFVVKDVNIEILSKDKLIMGYQTINISTDNCFYFTEQNTNNPIITIDASKREFVIDNSNHQFDDISNQELIKIPLAKLSVDYKQNLTFSVNTDNGKQTFKIDANSISKKVDDKFVTIYTFENILDVSLPQNLDHLIDSGLIEFNQFPAQFYGLLVSNYNYKGYTSADGKLKLLKSPSGEILVVNGNKFIKTNGFEYFKDGDNSVLGVKIKTSKGLLNNESTKGIGYVLTEKELAKVGRFINGQKLNEYEYKNGDDKKLYNIDYKKATNIKNVKKTANQTSNKKNEIEVEDNKEIEHNFVINPTIYDASIGYSDQIDDDILKIENTDYPNKYPISEIENSETKEISTEEKEPPIDVYDNESNELEKVPSFNLTPPTDDNNDDDGNSDNTGSNIFGETTQTNANNNSTETENKDTKIEELDKKEEKPKNVEPTNEKKPDQKPDQKPDDKAKKEKERAQHQLFHKGLRMVLLVVAANFFLAGLMLANPAFLVVGMMCIFGMVTSSLAQEHFFKFSSFLTIPKDIKDYNRAKQNIKELTRRQERQLAKLQNKQKFGQLTKKEQEKLDYLTQRKENNLSHNEWKQEYDFKTINKDKASYKPFLNIESAINKQETKFENDRHNALQLIDKNINKRIEILTKNESLTQEQKEVLKNEIKDLEKFRNDVSNLENPAKQHNKELKENVMEDLNNDKSTLYNSNFDVETITFFEVLKLSKVKKPTLSNTLKNVSKSNQKNLDIDFNK